MGRGPGKLFETGIVEALERAGARVWIAEASLPEEKFQAEIASAFALQAFVAERVGDAKRRDAFPIVLSGNCNTAVGTVAGLTSADGSVPTVCWLDAHADFNTPETTTSGFLDGMAVSMLAGRCWTSMTSKVPGFVPVDESRIAMIGVRDVDTLEGGNVDDSGVTRLRADFEDADLDALLSDASQVYLHVDLDVFDVSEGRANRYAGSGGLTRDRFMKLAAHMQQKTSIGALALTAYDPSCDPDKKIAHLAIDIAVALGTGRGLS